MRLAISEDCTAEPPGELMASATAVTPPTEKLRSSVRARPLSDRPLRQGPSGPMTPTSRSTATTGTPRARAIGSQSRTRFISRCLRLQDQPDAVAQDHLGRRRVAAIGLVQDEAGREPRRCAHLLARP